MRRIAYAALMLIGVLTMSGCARFDELFDGKMEKITFVASFADQTRTSYKGGGKVDWVEGDSIWYYTKKDGSIGEYEVVRSGHSTNVVADVTSGSSYIVAAYGGESITDNTVTSFTLNGAVKSTQTGKFEDAHVSVAKGFDIEDGASLVFHNMTSLIKFTLERTDVSYITFTAYGGEKIHSDGVLKITFEDDKPSATFGEGGGSTIKVNTNGAGIFYLATLPVELRKGFTISYFDNDGNLIGLTPYSGNVTIASNELLNLSTVDGHIVITKGGTSKLVSGSNFNSLLSSVCGGNLSQIEKIVFKPRSIVNSQDVVSSVNSNNPAYLSFDSATGTVIVATAAEYFELDEDASSMFAGLSKCKEISGLQYFVTENCINTGRMFMDCSSLKSIDLSSFDFCRDTSMMRMFANDSSLTNIVWPEEVNMMNLQNLGHTFRGTKFSVYDLSKWKNLKSLSGTAYLFAECPNCTKVIFPEDVDFSCVSSVSDWFYHSSENLKLDLTGINTETLPRLNYMFSACYASEIDCTGWDTSNTTNQSYLFYNCLNLHTLRLGDGFLGTSCTASTCWFSGTTNKPTGDGALTQTGIVPGHVDIYCSSEVMDWVASRATVKYVNDGQYNKIPCPVRFFDWKSGEEYYPWDGCVYIKIALDPTKITVLEGELFQLQATITPSDAKYQQISWSSSDTSVATVDAIGNVSALKAGSTTITARVFEGDYSYSSKCKLTVISPDFEYVNLGLSVKWATCNLGASKPEAYGGYYQWAGLQDVASTSINLDYNNCPYHTGSDYKSGWTKYIPFDNSSYWAGSGIPDNETGLDLVDDVAHVKLGGNWRTPTDGEWQELIDNCTSQITTLYGVTGRRFTSKINGNIVFLPSTCYRYHDGLSGAAVSGYYWSSSLCAGSPNNAYCLYFGSDNVNTRSNYRYCGQSVRPVYSEVANVMGVSLNKTSLTMTEGDIQTLTATISPSYASNKKVTWTSSDASVARVDASGKVTGIKAGSVTITVSSSDGGYTAKCTVTVKMMPAGAVDMGLSVFWATCNLGANAPEEYGDYYAWGDIETYYEEGYAQERSQQHWKSGKSEGYSNNNYKFYKIEMGVDGFEYSGYTKYVRESQANSCGFRGFYDNKEVLDSEDDVAHIKLGGKWRMPTYAEFRELQRNCTWQWVVYNGVNGYKVTSRVAGYTDKWIFLPAAGYRYDTGLYDGSYGKYWSSSLYTSNSTIARFLNFNSTDVYDAISYSARYDGLSVRPVSD